MRKTLPKMAALSVLALAVGCASTGVVPMDKGTFMVSKRSAQAGFGPPVGAKADVYKEASAYCAKQGQVVETVEFTMTDSGFAKPGSVSLQFRCVQKYGRHSAASELRAMPFNVAYPAKTTSDTCRPDPRRLGARPRECRDPEDRRCPAP